MDAIIIVAIIMAALIAGMYYSMRVGWRECEGLHCLAHNGRFAQIWKDGDTWRAEVVVTEYVIWNKRFKTLSQAKRWAEDQMF